MKLSPSQVLDLTWSDRRPYWKSRKEELQALIGPTYKEPPLQVILLMRIIKISMGLERCEAQMMSRESRVITRGQRDYTKLGRMLTLCFKKLDEQIRRNPG